MKIEPQPQSEAELRATLAAKIEAWTAAGGRLSRELDQAAEALGDDGIGVSLAAATIREKTLLRVERLGRNIRRDRAMCSIDEHAFAGASGGLHDIAEWITDTSVFPQPELALAAALSLVSVVAGRRYQSPTGVQTGFLALGLAESGAGKERPLAAVGEILDAAGLGALLVGEDVKSGTAVAAALAAHPTALFALDEYGRMLQALADPRAPRHIREIADTITRMATKGRGSWRGAAYADRTENPATRINRPSLSVLGMSQPEAFYRALRSDQAADGSLARYVLFQAPEDDPERQAVAIAPVPQRIVDLVLAIRAGADGWDGGSLIDGAMWGGEPHVVPISHEAALVFDEAEEVEGYLRRVQQDPRLPLARQKPFAARLTVHAVRIAMLNAIARHPAAPQIEADDARFGLDLAQASVDGFIDAFANHVADSAAHAARNEVASMLRNRAPDWVPLSDISRAVRRLSPRERQDALQSLIEAGEVEVMKTGTSGRSRQDFRWIG